MHYIYSLEDGVSRMDTFECNLMKNH